MPEERQAAYVTVKHNKGKIIVETPFNMDFIDQLKACVPYQARRWGKEGKYWEVTMIHKQTVINMVRAYYREIPAYLIEGAVTTNLHTGEVVQQQTLFGEG